MKTLALLILLTGVCAFVSADDDAGTEKGKKLKKLIGFFKKRPSFFPSFRPSFLPSFRPSHLPSGHPHGPPKVICCKRLFPRHPHHGDKADDDDNDEVYEDHKGKGPKGKGPIYGCKPCPSGPRPSGRPSGRPNPSERPSRPTFRLRKSDEDELVEEEDAGIKDKLVGILSKISSIRPSLRPSGRPCGPPAFVRCMLLPSRRDKGEDDDNENDEVYEDHKGRGPKRMGASYLCKPFVPGPQPSGRPSGRPHPSGRPSGRPRPTFRLSKSDDDELPEEDAGLIEKLKKFLPSRRPSNRPSGCPHGGLQKLCCKLVPRFPPRVGEKGDDDDDSDEEYEEMDKEKGPKRKGPIILCAPCPPGPRPSGRPSGRPHPSGRPSGRPHPSGRPSRIPRPTRDGDE